MMWMWLVTLIAAALAVDANDVFPPPEETETTEGASGHLEDSHHHKVHNLVLNPQQHSLCELKHIRQIITHPHCVSKEIENHVCVGTCFSYSVPQTDPETPGDELLDYCDSCQAAESHWTTVALNCEEYGTEYEVEKRIQMITNCSCSPCHPAKGQPITTNEVTLHGTEHHVSELIYKMLPDYTHKFKEGGAGAAAAAAAVGPATPAGPTGASPADSPVPVPHRDENAITKEGDLKYTQISLGDLKKEFHLDAQQETLLVGKPLFRDSASFVEEQEDPRHLNY